MTPVNTRWLTDDAVLLELPEFCCDEVREGYPPPADPALSDVGMANPGYKVNDFKMRKREITCLLLLDSDKDLITVSQNLFDTPPPPMISHGY